jgi:hypothetical protein
MDLTSVRTPSVAVEIADSRPPKEEREAQSHGTTGVVRDLKVAAKAAFADVTLSAAA